MSDFDLDNFLAGAVDDYREHTLAQIKPAGSAVARATATHRKRVHAAAMSLVALVVVAAPIAAYAATEHNHNGPPVGVGSSSTASPTDAPSPSPSVTASAAPAVTLAPVTEQDLSNGTLDIPSWGGNGCPSGRVQVHNGQLAGGAPLTRLSKTATVDLDKDGSAEAVAIFECQVGNPSMYQAVGFHRAADGSIQTMGRVLEGIDTIKDVRAGADGTVDLQVSDLAGSDGRAMTSQMIQWRGYGWTGSQFIQATGSTSFTVAVPGLTVTESNLTFEPPANGKRIGTMTVTLHNAGTMTISNASVVYELSVATVTSPTCDRMVANLPFTGRCPVRPIAPGTIAPGATATVTFTLTAAATDFSGMQNQPTNLQDLGENLVQVNIGDQRLATQPSLGVLIVK
jgi:hypothetical protein